jgi:hypothetical protein
MMYQLRALKTNDIYPMSKILKKLNLKKELDTKNKTQAQLGAELILSVFENLYMAQDEVNNFIGSMVGITGEEFGELPIEESQEIIMKFKKMPNIANFFKLAGQLTK